jgi:hypothetical protein
MRLAPNVRTVCILKPGQITYTLVEVSLGLVPTVQPSSEHDRWEQVDLLTQIPKLPSRVQDDRLISYQALLIDQLALVSALKYIDEHMRHFYRIGGSDEPVPPSISGTPQLRQNTPK